MKPILIAGIVALAACTSAMSVESANTDAVTISFAEGYQAEANREAEKQCQAFGKRAKFRNTRGESGRRWSIYDCIV
ncbi:MAG: hypothetical protein JNK67_07415 [Alphaproteobacteria bacterium]|nr:hypothetical protein [Alphaproteobacteria bacterium]